MSSKKASVIKALVPVEIKVVSPEKLQLLLDTMNKALEKDAKNINLKMQMTGGGFSFNGAKETFRSIGGLATTVLEKFFYSAIATYTLCLLSTLIVPMFLPGSESILWMFNNHCTDSIFFNWYESFMTFDNVAYVLVGEYGLNFGYYSLFALLFKPLNYIPGIKTVTKQFNNCMEAWVNLVAITFAYAGIGIKDLIKTLMGLTGQGLLLAGRVTGIYKPEVDIKKAIEMSVLTALEKSKQAGEKGIVLDDAQQKMMVENKEFLMRLLQKQILDNPEFMMKVLKEKKEELAEEKEEIKEEILALQAKTPPPSKTKTTKRRVVKAVKKKKVKAPRKTTVKLF